MGRMIEFELVEDTPEGARQRTFRLYGPTGMYRSYTEYELLNWEVKIPERTYTVTVELTETELRLRADYPEADDTYIDPRNGNLATRSVISAANKYTDACKAKVGELDGG
jgi:hypothetical protein